MMASWMLVAVISYGNGVVATVDLYKEYTDYHQCMREGVNVVPPQPNMIIKCIPKQELDSYKGTGLLNTTNQGFGF